MCLLGLWLCIAPQFDLPANFDFSQFYIGDVNSDVLFRSRFHTFVIDDTESCFVPLWIRSTRNTTGTLVTAKQEEECHVPEGWNVVSPRVSTPLSVALWLCSQSDKMLCLLIHNSGSTPFGERKARESRLDALAVLTKQTLAAASNEDCTWRCNHNHLQSCLVVPSLSSSCLLSKLRPEELFKAKVDKGWPIYVEQCELHYKELDWYRVEEVVDRKALEMAALDRKALEQVVEQGKRTGS